jgi:hypothetical protein
MRFAARSHFQSNWRQPMDHRHSTQSNNYTVAEPGHSVMAIAANWKYLKKVARPEGFEPPTLCSGGTRSIQLSYGRTDRHR